MSYLLGLFMLMLTLYFRQYKSLSANTPYISDNPSSIFNMGPLAPTCTKGIITSFKYSADGSGGNNIQINYTYVENSSIEPSITVKTTTATASSGINMADLGEHLLDCGGGSALANFALKNNGTFIWYEYGCRKAGINWCGTWYTDEFQASDLASFKNCRQAGDGADHTVMQGFKLNTRIDGNGLAYFKYQFTQCDLMLCDVACNGCTYTGAYYCKACNTDNGYYPVVTELNHCTNQNPGQYHLDNVTWRWEINCLPQCLTCDGWGYYDGTYHQCLSCAPGYFPRADMAQNCYSSNPGGYFLSSVTNKWENCYDTCKSCTGLGDNNNHKCLTCWDYSFPLVDKPNLCYYQYNYQNYLSGYFLNTTSKTFEKCHPICKQCSQVGNDTDSKCDECISNSYFLENTQNCISYVPYGYYLYYNYKWLKCYASCGHCYGEGWENYHECTECRTGYFPLQDHPDMCYQTVQLGYYKNATDNGWNNCYESCAYCTGLGTVTDQLCTSCRANTEPPYHPGMDKATNCYQSINGYFWNVTQLQWNSCYSSCGYCTGLGTESNHLCTECKTGYYRLWEKQTNCYSSATVPSAHYFYQYEQQWVQCYDSCASCTNGGYQEDHKCTQCKEGFYPLTDKPSYCYDTAQVGYYKNETQNGWNKCYYKCNYCTGLGNEANHMCTQCAYGYYPKVDQSQSMCYQTHDTGYYLNQYTWKWELCYTACKTCDWIGNDQNSYCTSCKTESQYFPLLDDYSQCSKTIPLYHFFNSVAQRWDRCYYSCETCDIGGNESNHNCTKCYEYYYPLQDKPANCYNNNQYGYFLNDVDKRWDKCYPSCGWCTGLGTTDDHKCTYCRTDSGYYQIADIQANCVKTRPDKYFWNAGQLIWERCYTSCSSCTWFGDDTTHRCTTCLSSELYYPLQDITSQCYKDRQPGYVLNSTQQRWDNCFSSCDDCTGLGNVNDHLCKTCKSGYYPLVDKSTSCFLTRPTGYFYNEIELKWINCYSSCDSCTGQGTAEAHLCQTCISQYYPLQDNSTLCYNTAQPGYFNNSALKRWDNCYSSCTSCTGLGTADDHLCIQCKTGFFPLQDKSSKCYDTTPPAYFKNATANRWDNCYISCGSCTELGNVDDHKCTTCKSTYYHREDKPTTMCYNEIAFGYFFNTTQSRWDLCYSSCASCTGKGNSDDHLCIQCVSEQYYPLQDKLSKCFDTVQPGYFNNSALKRWDKCYSSCTSCTGLGTADDHLCIQCKTGFFPLQDKSSKCYDTNPPAYFKNVTASRWDNCYISCGSCTELGTADNHLCTSCSAGYYTRINESTAMCYNTASYGHYLNVNIWDLCYESCAYCTAYLTGTDHMCTECATDHYPLQNKTSKCFVSTLPVSGYFFNDTAKRWDNCYSSCDSCDQKGNDTDHLCSTCLSGFHSLEDKTSNCYDSVQAGYYLNQNRWDLCYNSCTYCSIKGTTVNHLCTTCKTGYYPLQDNNTMCFNTVQYGYYFHEAVPSSWNNCYDSCAYCTILGNTTDHNCTQCRTDYFPLQDKLSNCFNTAQYGYFWNNLTQTWDNCYSSCGNCSSLGTDDDHLCTQCRSGYYPLVDKASKCYNNTGTNPYSYFLNANQWVHCYNSCASCNSLGTDLDNLCITCKTDYFKKEDRLTMCLNTLPQGYYFNTTQQQWNLCYSSCDSCDALGTDNDHKCTKCTSNYYPLQDKNSSCYSTNQSYYFFNSTLERWDNCYPSCGNCSSLGDDTDHLCTECKVNYYPVQDAPSKCYDTAPYGYAFNITKWDHCYTSCDDCTSLATSEDHNCIHCKTGYHPLVNHTSMCFDQAQYGYYLNGSMQRWDLCLSNCRYCSGLGTLTGEHNCTECATEYGYYPLIDKPSRCYSTTPYGYYFNNSLSSWDKCFPSCGQCTGIGSESGDHLCTECRPGFYPLIDFQSKCYSTAQLGYYLNTISHLWEHCLYSCSSCTGLGTEDEHSCIQCNQGYYPLQDRHSMCYGNAPYPYIFNPLDQRWDLCYHSCRYCTAFGNETDHKCTECNEPFYPLQDKPWNCFENPPPGYFFNATALRMDICYISCATCDELGTPDTNKCTSCKTDYFPVEDSPSCLKTSPPGYYLDQNKAMHKKCNDTCSTCASLTSCLTCKSEFYFLQEKSICVASCPDGYFSNGALRTCDKCSESCITCINDKAFCLTCKSGLFFLNNTCIGACPANYFQDSSNMTCSNCYESCKTCKGVGKSDCLSCNDGFPMLKEGQCTAGCLDNELYLATDKKCLNVASCILSPTLNITNKFGIESSNFIANASVELKTECLQYKQVIVPMLTYEWSDLYEGVLSYNNTILTIPAANLKAGNKNFTIYVSFNKVVVANLSTICQFKTNKLVPVVANSDSLSFVFGYPITIDASLSYDEGLIDGASSSTISDPNLVFEWKCPTQINTKCALYKNKKILTLTPDDYSGLNETIKQRQNYSCTITLILSKGTRTGQLDLNALISNPTYGIVTSNSTSTSNTTISQKKNYEQLAVIQPLSRGMKDEDLLFQVAFLDPSINITGFNFYWTVGNLEDPAKYLNGRTEDMLRIKNEDLPLGETVINLDFSEKSSPTIKYVKKYPYKKAQPPYGGNCQTNPSKGSSLVTSISFSASGWLSGNLPLIYKYYMTNRNGLNVSLTEDTIPVSEYTTWIIPVGDKYYVDVIDSAGLSSTYSCTLVIEKYTSPSQKPPVLNDLLEKTTNAKMKLLIVEAYNSNDFPLDSAAVEASATMVENMLDTSSNENLAKSISKNGDIILSQLSSISSTPVNSATANAKIDNVISAVVNNMDSIVQDTKKVGNLVNIISSRSDSLTNTPGVNATEAAIKTENLIKEVQIKVSQSIVPGQTVAFSSPNFNLQISKPSRITPTRISVPKASSSRLRERRLQTNEEECAPDSVVCLSTDLLKNISDQIPGEIALLAKLNKKGNILPISEESFGEDSLSLNFASQDQGTLRILSSNDLIITYTVRLQAPYLNSSKIQTKINETACVQYDNNYIADSTSCTTWYDYDTMEIVCICTKQGLTVNVFDKTFSSFSKLAQFPALTGDLINVYSLSIVCSLVVLLLVLLGIAYYKDKQDKIKKKYLTSQYFDVMQYYIIRYTKEGFNKDYSIKRLYWYVLKTNHPILSIMTIYSEKYYRQLRVLDFFLQLFISFFFTFLPLYASDNEVKVQNENSRSIRNISARFDEFGLTIQQILNGIIYSILSNFISMIITLPLTFMIYSDVMKQESEKRKNAMQSMVRFHMTKKGSKYAEKFAKGLFKIKTLILITHKKSELACEGKEIPTSPKKCDQSDREKILKPKLKIEAGINSRGQYEGYNEKKNSPENSVKYHSLLYSSRLFLYDDFQVQQRIFSEENENEKKSDTSGFMKIKAESFELLHESSRFPLKAGEAIYSIEKGERCCIFNIPSTSEFRVSCIYCNYSKIYQSSFSPRSICHKVLSHAKLIIIIGLDIFILIYLMVFIAGIYQNFGTQIVKMVIVPLITVFICKLVILSSLMFLVITLLMYYAGPYIYSRKGISLKVILFNLIVPPIASSHHQAILLYRAMIRGYK